MDAVTDVLHSRDLVVHLITRGDSMNERRLQDFVNQQGAVARPSTADEISKLAALRDSGTLTEEEFAAQKSRLLRA